MFKNPNENWPWHCHKCEYDLCDQCIAASPCKETVFCRDAVDNIKELVIPHICSGLTSLENFVLILDSAPLARGISVSAANRLMPGLLGLAKSAHESFSLADSAINKINSELDNDFLKVVEQEKSTADRLDQTKQSLTKLQENLKVLQQEYNEVKQQLSREESKLKSAQESLKERQRQLEAAEEKRRQGELIGGIVGGVFLGPLGALVGLAIADAVENPNVSNAEQAVTEASSRVTGIKRRVKGKEKELSNLENEKEQEERKKRREGKELESLKARKQKIKESQRRLAILNESIKNCTTFVNLTTARAKMMADEAKGQLPDIGAMLLPLKAVAEDLSDAALSNNKLLSGSFNMKQIGSKIQAITSKVMKSLTSDDLDQWA